MGYMAGAFAEIDINKFIGIQPELLYSQTMTKRSSFSTLYNSRFTQAFLIDNAYTRLNYLSVPVLLRLNLGKLITFNAGPQFGILMGQDKNVLTNAENAFKTVIPTIWVHRAKGLEVKSRLVVQGYKQVIADKDDTYASTPSVVTLKLLLTLALSKSWFVLGGDVSAAFLHADWVGEDILVFPPAEFYPQGGVLWRLRKAFYGLKNSPRLWQDYFASVLDRLNFMRCKTDANLYKHLDEEIFVLCYVDDLLVLGKESKSKGTFSALKQELLLRDTGALSDTGDKLEFLDGKLDESCDGILFTMDHVCVEKYLLKQI
jgi:hypothetical protein